MTPANDQTGAQALIKHFKNDTKPADDQFMAAVKDISQNGPDELKGILSRMIKAELGKRASSRISN
jgi:hypothetical protein